MSGGLGMFAPTPTRDGIQLYESFILHFLHLIVNLIEVNTVQLSILCTVTH